MDKTYFITRCIKNNKYWLFLEIHIYGYEVRSLYSYVHLPTFQQRCMHLFLYLNSFVIWIFTIYVGMIYVNFHRILLTGFLSGCPVFQKVLLIQNYYKSRFKFSPDKLNFSIFLLAMNFYNLFRLVRKRLFCESYKFMFSWRTYLFSPAKNSEMTYEYIRHTNMLSVYAVCAPYHSHFQTLNCCPCPKKSFLIFQVDVHLMKY